MGKALRSAAVVVVSAGLVAGVSQAPAQAFTRKELKVCWFNNTVAPVDFNPVADGPSYRAVPHMGSGLCKAWDVRPGQYKFTVADANQFLGDYFAASCAPATPNKSFTVRVKRAGKQYRDYSISTFVNGNIVTNVKKNRATTIAVQLKCSA